MSDSKPNRFIDFIEHPLFFGPVGVLAGIMGLLWFPPILIVCGICILVALHRSRLLSDVEIVFQVPAYVVLGAILVLAFSWLNSRVQKWRNSQTQEIVQAIRDEQSKPSSLNGQSDPCVRPVLFDQIPIQAYGPDKAYGVSVTLKNLNKGTAEQLRVFATGPIIDIVLTFKIGEEANSGNMNVKIPGDNVADVGLENYQREFKVISTKPISVTCVDRLNYGGAPSLITPAISSAVDSAKDIKHQQQVLSRLGELRTAFMFSVTAATQALGPPDSEFDNLKTHWEGYRSRVAAALELFRKEKMFFSDADVSLFSLPSVKYLQPCPFESSRPSEFEELCVAANARVMILDEIITRVQGFRK